MPAHALKDFGGLSIRARRIHCCRFDMRAITVNGKRRTWSCATGVCPYVLLAALAGTVMFGAGCDTPYTRRVRQLDNAYQRGDLPREDYMRFVHEAERWETR